MLSLGLCLAHGSGHQLPSQTDDERGNHAGSR